MKIALCVPAWPPGIAPNGIITYASYLVPALRALGHEIFILAFWTSGEIDDHTVDLRSYGPRRPLWMRALARAAPSSFTKNVRWMLARAIADLDARHRLDVVEVEEARGLSLAVSRARKLPVVVRLHGPWFISGRFGRVRRSAADDRREVNEGHAVEVADFITSPSEAALTAVRRHYGLSLPASRVIANPIKGVDSSATWSPERCDANKILFVGRFDELKGADIVLRAFCELASVNPELRLTFVGRDDGVKHPNGELVHFEEFVRSECPDWLRPRIDFRGTLDHTDVMALRTQCALTLVASRYEVFGYTVVEAMSVGSPLVATAVGGIPELIKDGRNGLLVPSGNVAAMVDACRVLLDAPVMAAKLARQAWQDCRDSYDPLVIGEQTVAAYREAIRAFGK